MTQDEVDQLRIKAMGKVQYAIRTGQLPKITWKTKCADCGERARCYDHRDYYKPLAVEPVCWKCNKRRGAANPVSEDRHEACGTRWSNLNDGEGIEFTFSGRCIAEIDIRAIEHELEKAMRLPDPDVRIANFELGKLKNVRDYQQQKNNLRRNEIVVGANIYSVEYTRRWPTPINPFCWKLKSVTKHETLQRRKYEKFEVA